MFTKTFKGVVHLKNVSKTADAEFSLFASKPLEHNRSARNDSLKENPVKRSCMKYQACGPCGSQYYRAHEKISHAPSRVRVRCRRDESRSVGDFKTLAALKALV